VSELADDDVLIEIAGAQTTVCAVIGRVTAAGARGTHLLEREVLAGSIDPCGECDICRRGGAAVCPQARRRGPLSPADRTVVAAARWVVPLADGLALPSPAGAAVAGDVVLAYTLYARTGLGPREPVVVVGADPVARFLVEILLGKGITPVVLADPGNAAWCEWLTRRGASVVAADTNADAVRPAIAAAFAGASGGRPWRVIATGGSLLAAALAGPRATLTVLATGDATCDLAALAAREVTVIGVAGAHPDLVVEAAAMCVRGEVDLAGGTAAGSNSVMQAIVRAG
jgi:6-hydroxycyclohex-1-ene-1-carbonyl-CoA dehydrogenase